MLFALLTLSIAAAQDREAYDSQIYVESSDDCNDTEFTGTVTITSKQTANERFTVTIEDSGGWSHTPAIKGDRANFTLSPGGKGVISFPDGERSDAKKSGWLDVAVSTDYGTSVRRLYVGPGADVGSYIWDRSQYDLATMASGFFLHETTVSCYSPTPDALLRVWLFGLDVSFNGITSYGTATDEYILDKANEAYAYVPCDSKNYTIYTSGYLDDPAVDGEVIASSGEILGGVSHTSVGSGFCTDGWHIIPGYKNWPEVEELLQGYVVEEDEEGGFVLFPEDLGKESIEYCRAWDKFTGVRTKGLWED